MQFPPILVINLKKRNDRWKQISKQLDAWNVPYERVEAIPQKIGWIGCNKSHMKCIELAKERKYPWVLVLEDDCFLLPNSKKRFEELLPILWRRREEWDIFNGGGSYIFKAKVIEEKPMLIEFSSYAAHFILHQERNYDRILKEAPHTRLDVYYRDRLYQWTTFPHLAVQSSGFSNLSKTNKNHRRTFRNASKYLADIIKKAKTRKNKKD
jgi:GR25 family glycosyltransferase involved in LPS biosynthesis